MIGAKAWPLPADERAANPPVTARGAGAFVFTRMPPAQYQRLLQDAVVHHKAGRLDQAEALYRRVRAALPNHFDAVHLSGIVALQQGRATEAVDFLTRAHRLAPKNAPCALRLGLALTTAGRAAEAEVPLRAAVALDANSADAWDALAHCLKVQDRLPD